MSAVPWEDHRLSLEVAAAAKRLACYAFLLNTRVDAPRGMSPEELARLAEALERRCQLYEAGQGVPDAKRVEVLGALPDEFELLSDSRGSH